MNQERLLQVIVEPRISEKATNIAEKYGQHVFKVAKDATKLEVKQAVEKMFNVRVKDVKTTVMKGKTRRFGQRMGKRSDWKKAYVSLHEGNDINFTEFE